MPELKKHTGFSLFEILIALSIIILILGFSIPSQKFFFDKSNEEIMSSQLLRAINLTRNESITRGVPVILCQSADQKTCGGGWQDGYIISADKRILFVFQNNVKGVINWRSFPAHRNYLQFLPTGLPFAENGTFWYCAKDLKNPKWAIVISLSGRARLVKPNAEGYIYDDKGDLLRC